MVDSCSFVQTSTHIARLRHAAWNLTTTFHHSFSQTHVQTRANVRPFAQAHTDASTGTFTWLQACIPTTPWMISSASASIALTVLGSMTMWLLFWYMVYSAPRVEQVQEPSTCSVAAEHRGSIKRRPQIAALSGMRLPAAFWVTSWHAISLEYRLVTIPSPLSHLLMTFFFELSGFVFASAYDDGQLDDIASNRAFKARRLARLFPAYYLALGACLCLSPCTAAGGEACLTGYPATSVFLQGWLPVNMCSGGVITHYANSPSWFASDLLIFSLMSPWLCRILPRFARVHSNVAFLIGIMALRSVPTMAWSLGDIAVVPSYHWGFTRIWEYVAGVQLARLFKLYSAEGPCWQGWGWIFDGCCLLAPFWKLWGDLSKSGDHGSIWLVTLLIFAAACASDPQDGRPKSGFLGRFFACGPLVQGAEWSHAFYHVSTPVRIAVPTAFWDPQGWWWQLPALLAACVAAAIPVTKVEHWLACRVDQSLKGGV
mmetsp:Transcript_79982/g.202409  ORF Transcript_79982/g.202409 Transcript_79982/m.202409 type:complete len:485 (+) Transcript_79982:73-1527(+)